MADYRNINCMIVPTGLGASIGGFAGDANPACKLLAKVSDLLITHPNVVNGAMFTDTPQNVAVVEGFFLDRFFAGQVALRLNVKHKIAVIVDNAANEEERKLTETCIEAASEVYGLDIIQEVFYTNEAIEANNLVQIKNPDTLLEACTRAKLAGATALAVLAVLDEDPNAETTKNYAASNGYDPIGLIEAKISHLVAQMMLIPCAHAPIIRGVSKSSRSFMENLPEKLPDARLASARGSGVDLLVNERLRDERNAADGTLRAGSLVAPKVAAEYLSSCFLASVLKTLQNSPQIIPMEAAHKILSSDYTDSRELGLRQKADDIVISQVANLVVPIDCCNGVPMIEAWKHEIELLCVKNNTTNLDEPATMFGIPHKEVHNYIEAAGYLLANTKDKKYINPALFL